MERTQWTGKRRALVIAALALACLPVSSSNLGSNWQCSKTAFVLTTCARSLAFQGRPAQRSQETFEEASTDLEGVPVQAYEHEPRPGVTGSAVPRPSHDPPRRLPGEYIKPGPREQRERKRAVLLDRNYGVYAPCS
jgi:hypothetical protein